MKRIAVLGMIFLSAFAYLAQCLSSPGLLDINQSIQLSKSDIMSQDRLEKTVRYLSEEIGHRNVLNSENLEKSKEYLVSQFRNFGYSPSLESYPVVVRRGFEMSSRQARKNVLQVSNVLAEKRGRDEEYLVLGAHYDSVIGSPGADDNASGVAVLLELARLLKHVKLKKSLKFIAYVNEEPPYFQTEEMGSLVSAKLSRHRGEKILGMISLESLGYFDDQTGTQSYPPPLQFFFPDRANFVSFVGNRASEDFLERCLEIFRKEKLIPSEGASLPGIIREAGFSDHWSYWQYDYQAFMFTDTAFLRNPHYHEDTDLPVHLDFKRMTLLTKGMLQVVLKIAGELEQG